MSPHEKFTFQREGGVRRQFHLPRRETKVLGHRLRGWNFIGFETRFIHPGLRSVSAPGNQKRYELTVWDEKVRVYVSKRCNRLSISYLGLSYANIRSNAVGKRAYVR